MLKKISVLLLRNLEVGSAISMRLVKLTGKYPQPIHPKHLVKTRPWFGKYLKKDDVVLDLGCGNGFGAIKVAKKVKRVVGLDINQKALSVASIASRNLKNIEFIKADANKKLPLASSSFDKVICADVLEHLNQRNYALSEIRRVLKIRGLLFLVVDNRDTSWKKLQKSVGLFYYADRDHKYEYTKAEIEKLLESKKFHILDINAVTYDTSLKGLIDLVGGFSLSIYKKLRQWREKMVRKFPNETTGFKIVAQKIA